MRNTIASVLAVLALAGCESASGPDVSSVLRYKVDTERERSVWLTREGVVIYSAAAQPVAIELPGWVYAGAPHCPPDLALGGRGEVVVTSNVLQTLWRIAPGTLAVTVHPLALDADMDKDVGFAAVVYSAEQGAFIAYSSVQRSVWKIDPALKTGTKLARAELREVPRPRNGVAQPCKDLGKRLTHLASSID
jgi:hypothetical protein